ncbi:MAG: holo-[acyl-carrier-protein] synthase [Deferribacteres bacterium]|nr:holo-[acyl-carrier-protein] synthase [Deferribacteres bacterium]
MIYGIGIDIVKIGRIRRASEKWGRKFLEKFLSQDEISYCSEKNDPYPSMAARFAAKEALIKAIGAKIIINMKDIEVVNDEAGRPLIRPGRRLEEYFREEKIRHCHLSLSHEKEFGVACVVLEK